MFELRSRDGLARRGRLTTPHGSVETPTLLPVIHPDPKRQGVPARELWERWGVRMAISSSYLLYRDPTLREAAERDGLHAFLGFPGTLMTDSGAFQQHSEGTVDLSPEAIYRFQRRIGTDIATVLDVFGEPEEGFDRARAGVEETLERARAARALALPGLIGVPVQGGLHPELRARSAREGAALADVQAIGGIVPLLERNRFRELVGVLASVRPHLAPEKPVHLFGLGHPMLFALGALWGGDLFDSASYHKFAQRDTLLFPEGSVELSDLREEVCGCALCERQPLHRVAELPQEERRVHLARHNLSQCLTEMARVRQAIHDGTLWELAERRAGGHPGLYEAMSLSTEQGAAFWPYEPEHRRAFRYVGPLSRERPVLQRWRERLARYAEGRGPVRPTRPRPLSPEALASAPELDERGAEDPTLWMVESVLGTTPLELTEMYPAGPALLPRPPPVPREGGERAGPSHPRDPAANAKAWGLRHALGLIEWTWGREARAAMGAKGIEPVHSRSTGRLRRLRLGNEVLFEIGNEGHPHPTFRGGSALLEAVPGVRGRITVHRDAAPSVAQGLSLFSRHVVRADPSLVPGSPALLVDAQGELLAVGRCQMAAVEMTAWPRGVAVRVSAHRDGPSKAGDTGK